MSATSRLIAPLPDGPLDLIGDIHGELDALVRLLRKLGCDPDAATVQRPIVFLGDLIDRGPNSPGVLRLVRRLCEAGNAFMVLGNHEINLLLGERRDGNGWFFQQADGGHFRGQIRRFDSQMLERSETESIRGWLAEQPLVRERPDLRAAHAFCSDALVAQLPDQPAAEACNHFDRTLRDHLRDSGLRERANAERAAFANLKRPDVRPNVALPSYTAAVVSKQTHNPVRAITSGPEYGVPVDEYAFYGGQWRTSMRKPWWESYDNPKNIVVGHYWRTRIHKDKNRANAWRNVSRYGWTGGHETAFCLDYSVGRRYFERWNGRTLETGFSGALAAMRWPERVLVFDDRNAPVPTDRPASEPARSDPAATDETVP